jgi:hypothetical protein
MRIFLPWSPTSQVSTRTEDFLIDVLELRHAMHALAAAFADPKIVKVRSDFQPMTPDVVCCVFAAGVAAASAAFFACVHALSGMPLSDLLGAFASAMMSWLTSCLSPWLRLPHAGAARRGHGCALAAARLRPVRGQHVRHGPGLQVRSQLLHALVRFF